MRLNPPPNVVTSIARGTWSSQLRISASCPLRLIGAIFGGHQETVQALPVSQTQSPSSAECPTMSAFVDPITSTETLAFFRALTATFAIASRTSALESRTDVSVPRMSLSGVCRSLCCRTRSCAADLLLCSTVVGQSFGSVSRAKRVVPQPHRHAKHLRIRRKFCQHRVMVDAQNASVFPKLLDIKKGHVQILEPSSVRTSQLHLAQHSADVEHRPPVRPRFDERVRLFRRHALC